MKKGQVANEFLILLGMGMIFLLIFLYAISDDMQSLTMEKEFNSIRDVGYSVQNEFFLAAGVKDGYFRQFKVPETHDGVRYNITISGGYLVLQSEKTHQLAEFAVPPVVGSIRKGENNISKEGGVIYLN
jgi:hypothetical protein